MKKMLLKTGLMISILLVLGTSLYAQAQRNPVLEECTGTWCQWCPCGHDVMESILATMPNAIMIGYHGGGGGDPWINFPGNQIMGLMGFSGYPTAVIDRTGPPMSRGAWPNAMNQRHNIPATVTIEMDKNYDKITRQLTADVSITPLENLTGTYNMTVIILEDSLIYFQQGNGSCTGGNNYVHNNVVRAIINGAQGEQINSTSPWNQGDMITLPVSYSIPATWNADQCRVVVLVSKVASPFYNSEIQQGEQYPLVSPDYLVNMTSPNSDQITDMNSPAQYSVVLHNIGLLDDTYTFNPVLDAPAGWTAEYTTENGTFPFGQVDSVMVATGDSTEISITINPNGFAGSGEAAVNWQSNNDPGTAGEFLLRLVTSTGVDILVVDISDDGYGEFILDALDGFYSGNYGYVSRAALSPGVDLTGFQVVTWTTGEKLPVITADEVASLEAFLDNGGRLLVNSQNFGEDIFETGGFSQHAQSFYNNYLHANYEATTGGSFFITGLAGDPIGDGISFVVGPVYDKSPDEISPLDSDATPVLQFITGPKVSSIKVETTDYRVVYFGVGFEQIDDSAIRDTLIARSINWLREGLMTSAGDDNNTVVSFDLQQNYPNPFNPATKIKFSIADESQVSLKIYDIMGREVADLLNERKPAGVYEVDFDASQLSSGVYIYKITAGDFVSSRKMILMK